MRSAPSIGKRCANSTRFAWPRSAGRSNRLDDQLQLGCRGGLDADLGADRQVGAAYPPQRVADAHSAAAVLDRLGERGELADQLRAALVEQVGVGIAAAF